MRVVHFNLSARGIGDYGLLLGDAFRRLLGNDFVLVARSEQAARARELGLVHGGIRDLRIDPRRSSLRRWLDTRSRLLSVIRDSDPAIVHDTAGTAYTPGTFHWPEIHRRAPLFVTEHDPSPHSGMGWEWHEVVARWLRRHVVAGFVTHGPRGREQLVDHGIEGTRVTVQPMGPFDRILPPGNDRTVEREPGTVLFFGALRPNKGVELLPGLARRLREDVPGSRLIVAGSPQVARSLRRSEWPRRLQGVLAELRSLPNVEVLDHFIPDEAVEPLFLRSEVTVLPYLDATQSAVAMLAMPLGSVVVATAVGDLPFAIRDGETGILCPPTPAGIGDALGTVLRDESLRRRIRRSAEKAVRENLSWDAIATSTLEAYESFPPRNGPTVPPTGKRP